MQGAQKTPMFNVVKFSNKQKDSTSELYQVVVKGCNRLFVTITEMDVILKTAFSNVFSWMKIFGFLFIYISINISIKSLP